MHDMNTHISDCGLMFVSQPELLIGPLQGGSELVDITVCVNKERLELSTGINSQEAKGPTAYMPPKTIEILILEFTTGFNLMFENICTFGLNLHSDHSVSLSQLHIRLVSMTCINVTATISQNVKNKTGSSLRRQEQETDLICHARREAEEKLSRLDDESRLAER
ncbi:hypothetical protein AMATHDRAFT_46505 [Amanita thiersii Skay4041]|uniref:Uncharacterized protein n=1 Tax=Amanita thiersii Skay4041 TaxID=703135 RepID=A0A2A9NS20_9AGAR|nr:hypothetical protein AMATHDRAFT_46505 [Amanita thiersii Skay4041]